jgi:hypothetical protein
MRGNGFSLPRYRGEHRARKRSYVVEIDRSDKGPGSVYRIEPMEAGEVSVAPICDREVTGEAPPGQHDLEPTP